MVKCLKGGRDPFCPEKTTYTEVPSVKKLFSLMLAVLCLLTAAIAAAEDVPAGENIRKVTISCTGDALLGASERVRRNGAGTYSYDTYIEKNGYAYPFAGLYDMFSKDDITFVNLENVLADDIKGGFSKSHLVFRGPADFAKILSAGSVEVVNLANNHTENYGTEGMNKTVAALEAEGIGYSGTTFGLNAYYIHEVGDIKVGFVGLYPRYHKDKKHQTEAKACFDACKEAGCQVIVASIHCGGEYQKKHANMQDKYEKICKSWGANLVIGNHPHVPQGIHVADGVTCLYSIGNFTFGGNTGVDEVLSVIQSYVAQFDLYFDGDTYLGHQLTIWPIHISGTVPENNYQPVLVSGTDAEKVMKLIQNDCGKLKLNPYVDGQGAVQDFVPWKK